MRDQEILGLMEAYSSIYTPQEELTEEVQIAAQYFYEMGLNEEGIDILIEELGVEEFAEFVYDIAEEYVLTEARAGGARIEPVTTKGQKFKSGKPTGKSLERLRAQKTARKESEAKASEAKPSGLKASLQRQSAIASAKQQQPKKKGVLDRLAGAVIKGIERHNAAMAAAKETGKTISKAAGKIGGVAKEVGKGATGAAKLAGHVASKGLEEEAYEVVLSYLLDEGFASTEEKADKIILNMGEAWFENIMELNRIDEARAEEKRGFGSTGAQRQRQKSGEEGPQGRRPVTSFSGGQNPHLRGKDTSKEYRRQSSRRYVDQPGGVYGGPENQQGAGRYAKMQAKKRDQSHMSSRFD